MRKLRTYIPAFERVVSAFFALVYFLDLNTSVQKNRDHAEFIYSVRCGYSFIMYIIKKFYDSFYVKVEIFS